MYSLATMSMGPYDDNPTLKVPTPSPSSVLSSTPPGSLTSLPPSVSLLSEPPRKYHHSQSYSLSTIQLPSSITPPASASSSASSSSQFFPTQNTSLNHMVLPESIGSLSSSANSTLVQNRTHRKSYGNHSISHTSTIDRLGDRQAFQPSHSIPKSRSISVSSPTEMFLPEYPSFKTSQNLVANEVIPSTTKFHSRSLSSSIPQSRGSLASSSLLSNSNPLNYTHSSSTDLKANIIFENSTPSHSNSYEIVPAMNALSISNNPPSFLQAETTVDEFPILVRRESTDFTSSAPASTLDLPQAPDLSPLAFSDHHSGFGQVPSSSHNSLSNSLNGSTQSLSSIFMANQLHTHAQPHPSLSEPSLQHMAMHDSQVLSSAPQQPPTISSYAYTQSNKQARSKPLKQATPAAFTSFDPVQHPSVDNTKRFPQPNGGISPNQQFPQAPTFKQGPVPQYRATSFGQHVPSSMENKQSHSRPSNVSRSVSAYQPRHFNAPRKQHEVEAASRFTDVELDKFEGDIYSICKDQHGCRYLQKVLDGQDEREIEMIFTEIKDHITELMTDLFGNYLCQKLLERVSSDQRTILVRNASPDLTKIALNQHGTRALQKMIEFSVAKEQVAIIVESLGSDVVRLIQDLNGNHVIQKCLNHLASEDSQFIIDAVSENCVTVGTHRHGCCVLQRCIDHSSEAQKRQLITKIIENSFVLVQDPFGNYVIQYVLELGILEYSESLIHRFIGHACQLSMQKFSSNVIEKCLRIALPETKKVLIEELVGSSFLDTLLRDSYANYVIQTTLEFADDATKEKILQSIIPILPAIRNTPYGRKIVAKLAATHDSSHVLLAQLQPPQFPQQALPQQQQQQHLQYQLNPHQHHHHHQPQQHQHQHQQHHLQHQQQQHQYQQQHPHQQHQHPHQHQHQHHQRQPYTQNRTIPLNPYYHGFSVPPVTNPAAQTVSVHDATKQ